MSDPFDTVYEEIIHDHFKKPKFKRSLEGLSFVENPSCGDKVRFSISIGDDGRISDAAFDGSGCSISMSSADILSEMLVGLTPDEAYGRISTFLAVLRGEEDIEILDDMGDAAAFKGVARLPVRVKCAALAWRAALAHLERTKAISQTK